MQNITAKFSCRYTDDDRRMLATNESQDSTVSQGLDSEQAGRRQR